jgi:hypothetical protein
MCYLPQACFGYAWTWPMVDKDDQFYYRSCLDDALRFSHMAQDFLLFSKTFIIWNHHNLEK